MKQSVLYLALLSVPATVLRGETMPFEGDLTFHARFEGCAEPSVAKNPERYYASELRYSYGVSGLAAAPTGRGYCRYPCIGNVDPRQGTASMWVRPIDWVGAEAGALMFLEFEGKGRLMLGKHAGAGGDLFLILQDARSGRAEVDHDIDGWLPGRWHHVAAAWGPKEIALYCDGKQAGRKPHAVAAPSSVEHFYVGRTRWSKAGESALDEVRVYRRPFDQAEIARLYESERERYAAGRRFPAGLEPLPQRLDAHGPLRVQVGDSRLFRFRGFDNLSQAIGLELTARIDRRACSQYYALALAINGRRVSPFLGNSRGFTRLVNKPFFYTYTAGGEGTWFGENWVVYYGLDWDDALEIKTASAEEPGELHRYVFDITDLLRPDQTNTLEIRNCAYTVRNATAGSDCPLVVKDAAIRPLSRSERKYGSAYCYRPAGTVVPKSYDRVEHAWRLLPCGAIEVKCAGATHLVESVYSYPGGMGNGFHSDAGLAAEPQWQRVPGKSANSILGKGSFYRVERTVEPHPGYLAVTDRITNTGAGDVGMVIENRVRVDASAKEIRLCGNRNITFAGRLGTDEADTRAATAQEFEAGFSSFNPTFFVRAGAGGLGIAMLDDVVRMQAKVFARPRWGGVSTDRFALARGKSYELTWKVFPVAEGDYYDFINAVRAAEGINVFEVDSAAVGKWYMSRWEEKRLKKWLDDRNLKYLIVGAEVPGMDSVTRHGPAFIDHADTVVPEYRELVRKCHQVRPQTRVVVYFSTLQFIDERDYAQRARGSLKMGANGKPLRYGRDYFCVHVDGKDAFSDELRKYIDFCLDTIGLDGIFWDVMACDRERDIDYSRWDGHSAVLDERYHIKRKVSIQGIEGIPFFVELIERIYAKDKVLLTDYFSGAKTVFAALRKHRTMGMMEGNNLGRCMVRTHLHTPLTMRGAEDPADPDRCFSQVVQNIRNNLRHGNLYAFYGPWVNLKHSISTDHIYPITPVELHEGYIVGKRKIVTVRSGSYGWPKSEAGELVVHLYSDKGEKVQRKFRTREQGGYRLVDVDLAPDYLAIVERKGQ